MAHYLTDPPDDLKPFDFDDKDGGDGFDDEIGGCVDEQFIPDEDLYDAINDETFGAEMAAMTVDDDFADFAIRTANLALFDDEPTTSLEPPDPSQIPIPKIGSGQNLQFADSQKTTAQKKKNITQNIPSGSSQIPSSSIWATGSFNGIGSLSELYMGYQPKSESNQRSFQHQQSEKGLIEFDELPNFSSAIGPPPGLFKPQTRSPQQAVAAAKSTTAVPLSAEELERKLLQEAASQINNQNRPAATPAPVNSAELEHKMLAEAMAAQQRQGEQQKNIQQQQYAAMQEMMRGIMAQGQRQATQTGTTASESGGQQQQLPTTTMPQAGMTPPPPLWYQQYLAAMMNAAGGNVHSPMPSMPPLPNANGQPMPPLWTSMLPPGMPPPAYQQFYQQWQQYFQQFAAGMRAQSASTTTQSTGGSQPVPGMPLPPPFLPAFFPPFPLGMPPQQQPPPSAGIHPMAFHQQNRPPPMGPAPNSSTPTIPPPPASMLPPPHFLPPSSGAYGQSSSGTPNSMPPMPTTQIAPHLHMVPASLHPQVEKQHRRQRANPALPSGKTIADYALDPYAGLMSTKEREWLIKIHIIQCLGTGDPMEDDFYYASWKQKNVLAKAPQSGANENPKYYKFEATFPAANYTAPSFMGALGKPVHSSSRIPRQIIEVGNENLEDESSMGGKQTAANRQKRLRAMLMKIENGALMLIDCRDIHRKLRFFEETCITEYIDKSEITDRVERFAENLANVEASIFGADQLATVMLIQKGRQLVFEWLQFLGAGSETRPKALAFLGVLMDGMGKFARKIPEESFGIFIDEFRSVCMQIPCQADLLNLMQNVKLEKAVISDSKLIQYTMLTALNALVRLNAGGQLSPSTFSSAFSIQHLSGSPIHFLLFDLPMAALKISDKEMAQHFDATQWEFLRQWLLGEQHRWGQLAFGGDNLAKWICEKNGEGR